MRLLVLYFSQLWLHMVLGGAWTLTTPSAIGLSERHLNSQDTPMICNASGRVHLESFSLLHSMVFTGLC